LLCFLRKTLLGIYSSLYHRGVVGTKRHASIRKDRRVEACLFFCVPKRCLKPSAAADPFPERGKAG